MSVIKSRKDTFYEKIILCFLSSECQGLRVTLKSLLFSPHDIIQTMASGATLKVTGGPIEMPVPYLQLREILTILAIEYKIKQYDFLISHFTSKLDQSLNIKT